MSNKHPSANAAITAYGDRYIDSLSEYIQQQFPGIKGFNRRGLYRMKQFYETYAGNENVSALLTQLSWTNHLLIMSGSKIHFSTPMLWYFLICRTLSTRTTSEGLL